jgi:iron complex transport system permease protein
LKTESGNQTLRRERVILLLLILLLLIVAVCSLTVGRYAVSPGRIPMLFYDWMTGNITQEERAEATVLFVIRIPRILLAIMVGGALAVSGAAYQGLFQNPMVSPDILGVSSGASVGAALGLLLGLGSGWVHLMAFAAGIGAVLMVVVLSGLMGRGNTRVLIMVLSGTVISSVFSSFTSLMKYVADTDEQLPAITFWLMGSFAKSGNNRNVLMMLAAMIVGTVPLMMMRWKINALSFGEEEAQSLGVNVKCTRAVIIFCSTLLTASSVCICGTIGWVGLIIPHITRFIVGPNYRALLPASMVTGGLFLLVVDNVARVIVPRELPIGILTSLIGAPLFVYLLFCGRKEWT